MPVFGIFAILIKLSSPGPVIFKQERGGRNGKSFILLKFRTMKDAQGSPITSSGDERITGIGKFLRKTKLDEMPQFINVLKGDMSLVGPRPLSAYNSGNTPEMKTMWQKRISVKPGLVSLVDMKGRNLVPWEKRFEYDLWYIDNQSFWLDLKILVLGFFSVLSRKGVYGEEGMNKPNN